MKNKGLLITIFCIALAGCSNPNNNQNTVKSLENKYDYQLGKCLVDETYVEYSNYNRGDLVLITDEDEDYYYIDNNGLLLAIKKDYIRTENEPKFVEYIGYTKKGTHMYSDIELNNEVHEFSLNDEIKVVDCFSNMLLVEYDGNTGYVKPNKVDKNKIVEVITPKNQTPIENYSSANNDDRSSQGGGETVSPSTNPVPTPTSGDGEDFSLRVKNAEYEICFLSSNNKTNGEILMDNTISYIASYNRNDNVKVIEEKNDSYLVIIGGRVGKVDKKYIRLNCEEPYNAWEGYSKNGTYVYADYCLEERICSQKLNEIVKVIDQIDDVLIVELENGQIGYMNGSDVSKDKIIIKITPKIEEPIENDNSNSNNSSPSYNSVPSSPTIEWTEPLL